MKHFVAIIFCAFCYFISFSQQITKYKGELKNFEDLYLGVIFEPQNSATAEYSYYFDEKNEIIRHGSILIEQIGVLSITNDRFGYYGSASGKTYRRITGQYFKNIKQGKWQFQQIEFGMQLSGGQFDFKNWNWNTLSVDQSKKIESIRTITVNYQNGMPEGELSDEVVENGKTVLLVKCKVHEGKYIDDFYGESLDLGHSKIYGKFNKNGFFDGDWHSIRKFSETEELYRFSNGFLLNSKSYNKATKAIENETNNILQNPDTSIIYIDTFQRVFNKEGYEIGIKFANDDSVYSTTLSQTFANTGRKKLPKSDLFDLKRKSQLFDLSDFVTFHTKAAGFIENILPNNNFEAMWRLKNRLEFNTDSLILILQKIADESHSLTKNNQFSIEDGNDDLLTFLNKKKNTYLLVKNVYENNILNFYRSSIFKYEGGGRSWKYTLKLGEEETESNLVKILGLYKGSNDEKYLESINECQNSQKEIANGINYFELASTVYKKYNDFLQTCYRANTYLSQESVKQYFHLLDSAYHDLEEDSSYTFDQLFSQIFTLDSIASNYYLILSKGQSFSLKLDLKFCRTLNKIQKKSEIGYENIFDKLNNKLNRVESTTNSFINSLNSVARFDNSRFTEIGKVVLYKSDISSFELKSNFNLFGTIYPQSKHASKSI